MPLGFNDLPIEGVNYNGNEVLEVYFNNNFIWPITSGVWYKYVNLGTISLPGINENCYELHLSRYQIDNEYKFVAEKNCTPAWQYIQSNVVGTNGVSYSSPTAYVRRVVIDNAITPKYLNHWFDHLYAGLNDLEDVLEQYPFEWVNLGNLKLNKAVSLDGAFYRCHATYLDLRSWDTINVVSAENMFNNCSAKYIYIGENWNLSQVPDDTVMFLNALNLEKYNSGYITKKYSNLYLTKAL